MKIKMTRYHFSNADRTVCSVQHTLVDGYTAPELMPLVTKFEILFLAFKACEPPRHLDMCPIITHSDG